MDADDILFDASVFYHWYNVLKPGISDSKYVCDKCEMKFGEKSELKRHEITIHYGKKLKCKYCDATFSREGNLRTHLELHAHYHFGKDVTKYACDICKMTFLKKSNLLRHSKVYHKCEFCSQIFCSMAQLQQHKKKIHPAWVIPMKMLPS